jgi:hypothetical protein
VIYIPTGCFCYAQRMLLQSQLVITLCKVAPTVSTTQYVRHSMYGTVCTAQYVRHSIYGTVCTAQLSLGSSAVKMEHTAADL